MTKYRDSLPQLSNAFFLTDGGIETTLIFHEGLDLPHFAAFDLLKDKAGYEALRKYFCTYAALAKRYKTGLVLESPTWRANPDWASQLGYDAEALAEANRKAIDLLCEIREEFESEKTPMVISGCVGPRGDGYVPAETMYAGGARVSRCTDRHLQPHRGRLGDGDHDELCGRGDRDRARSARV